MGIRVDGLCTSVMGHPALRDVSFEVHDGDFVVILGPTGSGKTRLLRAVAGVDRYDSGVVAYDGRDMGRVAVRKRPIAMVYQQFVNYPSLTVFENIASPLRVGREKLSRDEIEGRVYETAELLRLEHVLDQRPSEVSGGQQQRTAIARALIKGAKYFFLDEPLGNLDLKLREELRGELKRLFQHAGGAAIYTTPDPVDALSMGTHVGVMSEGRLLQYGPAREVYNAPMNAEVGAYFSYPPMNILPARVEGGDDGPVLVFSPSLRAPAGALADAAPSGAVLVGIRAHRLHLERRAPSNVAFTARVVLSEVVGSDTEIHADHEGVRFRVLTEDIVQFNAGDALDLYLDVEGMYLFDGASGALVAQAAGAA